MGFERSWEQRAFGNAMGLPMRGAGFSAGERSLRTPSATGSSVGGTSWSTASEEPRSVRVPYRPGGSSRTAFTTLKMAVLALSPSASVSTFELMSRILQPQDKLTPPSADKSGPMASRAGRIALK